jgi:hypothetical protein
MKSVDPAQRREALITLGRAAMLGLLSLGGALLVFRKGTRAAGGNACIGNNACASCGILRICSLPQAEPTRRTAMKKDIHARK